MSGKIYRNIEKKEFLSKLNDWQREQKPIRVNEFGPGVYMPPLYLKKYKHGVFKKYEDITESWTRLFFNVTKESNNWCIFIHTSLQYNAPDYVYMETDDIIALGIVTDNLHTEYNKKLWLEIDK